MHIWLIRLLILICLTQFISIDLYSQCGFDITVPDNIIICGEEIVDLDALVSPTPLSVSWSDENGVISTDLNASALVNETTTFTFNAFGPTSNNLVFNGDFEMGDTGFTSGYLQGDIWCPAPQGPLWCEGMYAVDDNPNDTHPNFASCSDHTSGSGNMMVANGSSSFTDVWCQDIVVTPNTNYLFSAWATSVESSSPAILQFTINGETIGNNFNVSNTTCDWQNFTSGWFSDGATNATICIQNQNLATSGNDFAIDDIEFLEVCEQSETVTVIVSEVIGMLQTSYTIDCDNPFVNLAVSPPVNDYTYEWEAQFGGTIAGPDDLPSITATTAGLYTVTITDAFQCTATLSTTVNGSTTSPSTSIAGDFLIDCDEDEVSVFSTNNNPNLEFEWEGSSSTSTIATYNQPGNYTLTITNAFNCSAEFDFEIQQINADVDYILDDDNVLNCIGDSTIIYLETDEDVTLEWFDSQGNSLGNDDSLIVNDIGIYIVEIGLANGCTTLDTTSVTSLASQLDYLLGESPTITCQDSIVELSVEVNSAYNSISWFQNGLVGMGESITVENSGDFIVDIEDQNGCITRDTLSVLENTTHPTFTTGFSEIDCVTGHGLVFVLLDDDSYIEWTTPSGSNLTTDSIHTNIPGLYIVNITNQQGCTASDTVNLTEDQNYPELTVEVEQINCNTPFANIIIESSIDNTSYFWVGPNGFLSTEDTLSVSEIGVYAYSASSPLGCTVIDTLQIIADFQEPLLEITPLDTINCITNVIRVLVESDGPFTFNAIDSTVVNSINGDTLIVFNNEQLIVEIEGQNGCISIDSIPLPFNFEPPIVPVLQDFTLNCNTPDSLIILESGDHIHNLWLHDFVTFEADSLLITEGGLYALLSTNTENECSDGFNIMVTTDFDAAEPMITAESINCNNDQSIIEVNSEQQIITIEHNMDLITLNDSTFTSTSGGIVDFVITYANGCSISSSIEIEVDTMPPFISANNYMFDCIQESVFIDVDDFIDTPLYNWEGPDGFTSEDEIVEVSIAGTYYVTVTNADNGCFATEDVEVMENNTIINTEFEIEQPLCFGDFADLTNITNDGGTPPYTNSPIDTMFNFAQWDALSSGSYYLITTDAEGCTGLTYFEVDSVFQFDVEAGKDTIVTIGSELDLMGSTTLTESNIGLIEWNPSNLLSCTDCLEPTILDISEDTWFTISVEDENGCVESDSVQVRVVIDYGIYVPNVFTPDNNGINDVFNIFSNVAGRDIYIETFEIYDRWGNKVFKENDFELGEGSQSWDGMLNGRPAQQGVYAYFFKAKFPEGQTEVYTGTVTLIR